MGRTATGISVGEIPASGAARALSRRLLLAWCKLVIELDDAMHALRQEKDEARTRFLQNEGYRVIRFWNNDVIGNLEGVMATVAVALRLAPAAASEMMGQGGGRNEA